MATSTRFLPVVYHYSRTLLTIDIHEVHFRRQIADASRGGRRYRGTAVTNKLEWLIKNNYRN